MFIVWLRFVNHLLNYYLLTYLLTYLLSYRCTIFLIVQMLFTKYENNENK